MVLTANANGASVDDLKSRAVGNWSEFIKAFETWVSKQASAKKEPENGKVIPAAPETTAPDQASRPAIIKGHQTPAPKTPPPGKSPSAMPLSYTPQYKNLMTRKAEFPNEYAAAKKELSVMPNTVEDCEKILSRMMELVEAIIDKDSGIPDGTD